jgi:hypothetical protein
MTVTEKRWIKFKGNPDPTTVPVEWNSWLNGRRERAPTLEVLLFLLLEYLVPQCFSPAFTFPTISKRV